MWAGDGFSLSMNLNRSLDTHRPAKGGKRNLDLHGRPIETEERPPSERSSPTEDVQVRDNFVLLQAGFLTEQSSPYL